MKRILSVFLAFILLCGLFQGCGPASKDSGKVSATTEATAVSSAPAGAASSAASADTAAYPITVTDQTGRKVTIKAPAKTIVSCYYLVTASLLTLGQKDKLVGIETKADTRGLYKLCAPDLLKLPGVGSGKEINVEAIAGLKPDLVILPKKQKDAAKTLEDLGITTVVVNPETYDAFNEFLILLGNLCGCQKQSEDLVAYYKKTADEVKSLTGSVKDRPSVYLCGDTSYLRTCTGGMYQKEMIEMAGGSCVSADIRDSTWADISAEQLIKWNPDVIFAVQYASYSPDDIKNDTALKDIGAVKNGKIYKVPSEIEAWDYPQPSSVLGLLWMTHILHPDLMTADEYQKKAKEFYKTYYQTDVTAAQLGLDGQ